LTEAGKTYTNNRQKAEGVRFREKGSTKDFSFHRPYALSRSP